MINLKTSSEIEKMRIGGKILSEVMWELKKSIKPGIAEIELDQMAEKLIIQKGGQPGFKLVEGYKYSICVSVNDVVVHGIPTDYILKDGDIIGIDCGVYYEGFHTDMSETFIVGTISSEIEAFLNTGKVALNEAIKQAKEGNHIGDISKTIEEIVEGQGYSVVDTLIGHGVGKDLHEDPEVPGFLSEKIEKTPLLKPGLVIAIEVIYNMGKKELVYANDDGWTLKTKDGSLGGLFERTVAITNNGPVILTP
jgi:methionyl aminopeptidase